MAKITIDREGCISCGVCWSECPECFEEGEDGLSQVVETYRVDGDLAEGEVPADLVDCATEAADLCPVAVIEVMA